MGRLNYLFAAGLIAFSAFSTSNAYSAARPSLVNPARASAIHKCCVLASVYLLYAWGNVELYRYRECMFDRGQME